MTKTFNVNSVAWSPVTVQRTCRVVEVFEDAQAGSTDYYVSETGTDGDRITRPAGSKHIFADGVYSWNDIAGYVKTAAGSVSFAQDERSR